MIENMFVIVFFSILGIISFFMMRDWWLDDKYGYECWNCQKRKGEQYNGPYVYECKECNDKRMIKERYCPVCKEKTILHWDICQKCGVRIYKIVD